MATMENQTIRILEKSHPRGGSVMTATVHDALHFEEDGSTIGSIRLDDGSTIEVLKSDDHEEWEVL